jgi:hypothetical protein
MSKRKGLYYVYQVQKTAKQQKNYLNHRKIVEILMIISSFNVTPFFAHGKLNIFFNLKCHYSRL